MQPARIGSIDTPFGKGLVAWTRGGVIALEAFVTGIGRTRTAELKFREIVESVTGEPAPDAIPAKTLRARIDRAMSGRTHDAPVDLSLFPELQRNVYRAVMDIPFGMVSSYGEIALDVGLPRAARAVGTALSKCPIDVIVPCHRVVHAGGRARAASFEWKRILLAREGVVLD